MIHIAIAEDNPKQLLQIEELIKQKQNCIVDTKANNGLQMLQYLHQCKHSCLPHIVIVDYEMNPVDGLQLAYYIHLYFPAVNILALSGHIHEHPLKNMYACGCLGFKNKYFLSLIKNNLQHLQQEHNNEFMQAIENVANGNYYFDSFFSTQSLFYYNSTHAKDFNKTQLEFIKKKKVFFSITTKQYQILYLFTIGATAVEIAKMLYISENTVNNHLAELKEKMQAHNIKDLITQAYRHQLVPCASYEYLVKYNGGGKKLRIIL